MTAKRSSKKTAKNQASKKPRGRTTSKPKTASVKKKKKKASGTKAVKKKKPAPARKKASKAKKSARPRAAKTTASRKTTKARGAKAAGTGKRPATRKSAAASRKPASKATRARPAARGRRRPVLNLRRFESQLRQKQSELLQAYMSAKGDTRTRESDGTEDYIDYAVSSYDREFLLSLTELEQSQLRLVEQALGRLKAGGFGLCTQCERPIPTKRLEVQPWAMYCVRCQELADSGLSDELELSSADDDAADEDFDDVEDEDEEPDVEVEDHDRLIGG